MGIIIKQSLRGSIWSYLGLIVGYINLGILMPMFFLTEQIGLQQLFIALSNIFTNFSSLGFGSVINRMFPYFRNREKHHNGFLFITLAVGIFGFVLSVVAFFILKPEIVESNSEKSPLLVEYIYFILPILFFGILFRLLDSYNKVLFDVATGAFLNEFLHKVINLLLVLLFAFEYIDFREFMYGYVASLSFPVFPLIYVLIKRGDFNLRPDFSFLNKPLVKEMIVVAAFGLFNGLSGVLTNNIDKLLINKFLSLEQVGIFSICALFATVIMVPFRSIMGISTGIIAQAWKENNMAHIREIFVKSSLNQMVIGSLIFIGILINIDNIFEILPPQYEQGRLVLIFYALGTLIRTTNTTGGAIIQTSRFYKVSAYFIVLRIIYAVGFQYFFILLWGLNGAAIAVLSTYIVGVSITFIYLKLKVNLFCYTLHHLKTLVIASVAFGIGYVIPVVDNLILNIILKSIIVVGVYGILILAFKVSEDINGQAMIIYKKIKNKYF